MLPYLLTASHTILSLSIHPIDPTYFGQIQESMDDINWWVAKFGITAIMSDNRTGWVRHYKGLGQFMRP
jgi:hypothetical protein